MLRQVRDRPADVIAPQVQRRANLTVGDPEAIGRRLGVDEGKVVLRRMTEAVAAVPTTHLLRAVR